MDQRSLKLKKILAVYILLTSNGCTSYDGVCDRRPLGTKTDPLPPDNQFVLDIDDIRENKYIPKMPYRVHLHSRDQKSTFIAFTISLQEDSIENKNNPRKPIYLKAGSLEPMPRSFDVKLHPYCNNTVMEMDITAKTSVEALWTAPEKDNKCVTVFAVVAVKSNVWYSFEGPLSKKVCEDPRKDDDIPPMENDDCQVCEDARYQLVFEGLWSYNTHPTMFPQSTDLARFSDIVGASHSKDFSVYTFNSIASLGLKMLAEQGNTTQLEIEIEEELVTKVRTVIKATSPPKPNMTTMTTFRASRDYHRLSIVTAILPSPDWFLGVSNLELCNVKTKMWANEVRLNLYPMDAGTDKGLTFESPNEETSPQQPISRAQIGKNIKEETKAFARLLLTLVRTYSTPGCVNEDTVTEDEDGDEQTDEEPDEGQDNENEDTEPEPNVVVYHPKPNRYPSTTTSEEPPSVDPDSTDRCPMSQWEEWFPCEGECVDNKLTGVQIRFRYHMVDDVAVGKYVENGPSYDDKEVSQFCQDNYPTSDTRECEEPCEEEQGEEEDNEEEANAERIAAESTTAKSFWKFWK